MCFSKSFVGKSAVHQYVLRIGISDCQYSWHYTSTCVPFGLGRLRIYFDCLKVRMCKMPVYDENCCGACWFLSNRPMGVMMMDCKHDADVLVLGPVLDPKLFMCVPFCKHYSRYSFDEYSFTYNNLYYAIQPAPNLPGRKPAYSKSQYRHTFLAPYSRNMPKSHIKIAAPLRNELLECFRAATLLVRPKQRRQLVLVGGSASIAYSSVFKTEDVDVAAPPSVLTQIWEAVWAGTTPNFSIEPDGRISFDAPQGFRVRLDLIQIGGGCIEQIYEARPFYEGSVASMSDLLRLRAVTVVERGSDGEKADFRWLLSGVARKGQVLPVLDDDDLEYVCNAGESCFGTVGSPASWCSFRR